MRVFHFFSFQLCITENSKVSQSEINYIKIQTMSLVLNLFQHFHHSPTTECKYFRLKLVQLNESVYCTPIDRALKMQFNEGSRSFIRPTIPMKVFVKSVVLFFGQNKYTNIRRFSTIFRHKIRIFCLQKVQQNTSKMATQHI